MRAETSTLVSFGVALLDSQRLNASDRSVVHNGLRLYIAYNVLR